MDLLQDLLDCAADHDRELYLRLIARVDELASALATDRRRLRNERLREASALLPPEPRRWARAERLAACIRRVERGIVVTAAERKVRESLDLDPKCPRSQRQLYRLCD